MAEILNPTTAPEQPPEPEQKPPEPEQKPPEPEQNPPEPEQKPPEPVQNPPEPVQNPPEPEQKPPESDQKPPEPEQKPKEDDLAKPPEPPKDDAMRAKYLNSTARFAAIAAGVPADRVDTLLKLADLKDIDVAADDADAKIGEAITKALELVPELRAAGGGTGGAGEHPREKPPVKSAFERGFGG